MSRVPVMTTVIGIVVIVHIKEDVIDGDRAPPPCFLEVGVFFNTDRYTIKQGEVLKHQIGQRNIPLMPVIHFDG